MGGRAIREAVERQSGACRVLADAMRTYAESMGVFRRQESRILLGFADAAASIADGLTEALAENTPGRLRALWSWSLHVAVPFTLGAAITGGAEGYVSSLVGSWGDNPQVVECATVVVENAEACLNEINAWEGDPSSDAQSNYPSPAAEYLGILLRRARFVVREVESVMADAGENLDLWELGLAEDPPDFRAQRIVTELQGRIEQSQYEDAAELDRKRERVDLMAAVVQASMAGRFRLEDFPRRDPI